MRDDGKVMARSSRLVTLILKPFYRIVEALLSPSLLLLLLLLLLLFPPLTKPAKFWFKWQKPISVVVAASNL